MPREEDRDDVELGEMEEEDAFIDSGRYASKDYDRPGFVTRWIPLQLRQFVENLSRIKLVLILLTIFFTLLLISSWFGSLPVTLSISAESVAVAKEVAKSLNQTAIPGYVLTYAPLVSLDKEDIYYPSDIATHVVNTHATINFTAVRGAPKPLSLDNLHLLNELGGESIYLTSIENVIKLPKFLGGKKPDTKTLQTKDAFSCVIICVDKGNGILDAFYMYFYTFNEGPIGFGHRVGNHLGDWEHNMVRFENGKPTAVWYSQHEYGEAYSYAAVQKVGDRPIGFSAKGSHANYAKSGKHDLHLQDEQIPAGVAYDHTSYGPLWDPTLSAYYYTYSMETKKLTPAKDHTPVNYLEFQGQWGDQEYGDEVEGQEKFKGFHKWTGGPQGPIFKHLDRKDVCLPNRPVCVIRDHV